MSDMNGDQVSAGGALSAGARAGLAVMAPLLLALAVGALAGGALTGGSGSLAPVPLLATLALSSWFLGLRWYGLHGLGLRGGRPLFASIGFAVLAWLPFLLFRFVFVQLAAFGRGGLAGQTYVYLLLFEAFAVQIWAFGVAFRSLAAWRGGLTAAVGSGLLFGMAGALFFREAAFIAGPGVIAFVLWGVLYGLIRLRTGSLLGTVLVQSLHTFTAWVVLLPQPVPAASQLRTLYLATAVAYLVVIWRLWPRRESDYRL